VTVTPFLSAWVFAFCIVGPSAMGSVKGRPSSIRSVGDGYQQESSDGEFRLSEAIFYLRPRLPCPVEYRPSPLVMDIRQWHKWRVRFSPPFCIGRICFWCLPFRGGTLVNLTRIVGWVVVFSKNLLLSHATDSPVLSTGSKYEYNYRVIAQNQWSASAPHYG